MHDEVREVGQLWVNPSEPQRDMFSYATEKIPQCYKTQWSVQSDTHNSSIYYKHSLKPSTPLMTLPSDIDRQKQLLKNLSGAHARGTGLVTYYVPAGSDL